MKNKILKAITYTAAIAFGVAGSSLDDCINLAIPFSIMFVSLGWVGLFGKINNWRM